MQVAFQRYCDSSHQDMRPGLPPFSIASRRYPRPLGLSTSYLWSTVFRNVTRMSIVIMKPMHICFVFGRKPQCIVLSWVCLILGARIDWQVSVCQNVFHCVGRSYKYGFPFLVSLVHYSHPPPLDSSKAVSPPISKRPNSDLIFYSQASVKLRSQSQPTASGVERWSLSMTVGV